MFLRSKIPGSFHWFVLPSSQRKASKNPKGRKKGRVGCWSLLLKHLPAEWWDSTHFLEWESLLNINRHEKFELFSRINLVCHWWALNLRGQPRPTSLARRRLKSCQACSSWRSPFWSGTEKVARDHFVLPGGFRSRTDYVGLCREVSSPGRNTANLERFALWETCGYLPQVCQVDQLLMAKLCVVGAFVVSMIDEALHPWIPVANKDSRSHKNVSRHPGGHEPASWMG